MIKTIQRPEGPAGGRDSILASHNHHNAIFQLQGTSRTLQRKLTSRSIAYQPTLTSQSEGLSRVPTMKAIRMLLPLYMAVVAVAAYEPGYLRHHHRRPGCDSDLTPEPTTPQVTTPLPTTPVVTTPVPTTPEVTTPEPTTPEVTTPEPTTPEVTTPEPTTPEVTTPEPTTPEPTTPEPTTPAPTTPEPTTPAPTTPEPTTPAPTTPAPTTAAPPS